MHNIKKTLYSILRFLSKLILLLIFLYFTTNLLSLENLIKTVKTIENLEIEDICIENIFELTDYFLDWLYFAYFILSMIYYTIYIVIYMGWKYFLLHWDIVLLNCLTYFLFFYLIVTTIFWLSWPLKFFWYWWNGDEEKLWGTNWTKYKKELALEKEKEKDKDKVKD